MKVQFDITDFSTTATLGKFASIYANNHGIDTASKRGFECDFNERVVFLYYEREAHKLNLDEIAEELGMECALIGKTRDGCACICGLRGKNKLDKS
jgi:hypothetical protein